MRVPPGPHSSSRRPLVVPPERQHTPMETPNVRLSRRTALKLGTGGLVLAGAGTSAAVVRDRYDSSPSLIAPTAPEVAAIERARATTGRVVHRQLTAAPTRLSLAGRQAVTWAYGGTPAAPIHVTAGDELRVQVQNRLPAETTVHWHGIALRNDMDGVPGVTMPPIPSGGQFLYRFIVPDPGTYWFHPHVGVQLDTGLMGALVVADPHEPLDYDEETVLLLDDWTDGVGDSPDEVLAKLRTNGMPGMSGMDMGGMSMGDQTSGMGVDRRHPLGKDTGDVRYPLHLINGRPPKDPASIRVKPGTRLRLRLINGGSDTAYRVAVGGHRLTVVASDGYPVEPVDVDTLILGMGERYDVLVTADSGVFPIIAQPEGKPDRPALAVLRTAVGGAPKTKAVELRRRLLGYAELRPTAAAALPSREPDRTLEVGLQMQSGGRRWVINGKPYADYQPLSVQQGERIRLRISNETMMFHPMHLHGHTFALDRAGHSGVRKDTINVLPMQQLDVDLAADNPGQWLLHCHNAYHGELGMMTVLSYVR